MNKRDKANLIAILNDYEPQSISGMANAMNSILRQELIEKLGGIYEPKPVSKSQPEIINDVPTEEELIKLVKDTVASWAIEEDALNPETSKSVTVEQRYVEGIKTFVQAIYEDAHQPKLK